ncbi:hypothetical protein [Acidiluteibacter ferrifornacis]|uniref:Uncharacterized protein n=1 Tax=Acidiluteibacter ferrifornacis TaxID=2692424 RepID=A0A6N9NHQ7_9FLAO|nr:hypothetical protein [Acidiluteibacter ferrifornacis]NBG65372.1 hypothetical protein [Acidiluteibacter ferrifornacis]
MLTLFDGIIGLFYALIILGAGWIYKNNQLLKGYTNYRFYFPSLFVHVFGAIGFCLVYGLYYGGGDSYYYFRGGESLVNMFFMFPLDTLSVYPYNISDLPDNLKYITTWLGGENGEDAFLTMKLASIFCLLGLNSFIGASIILSFVSFLANWKLFKVINSSLLASNIIVPKLYYLLFIPSLLFWGTGILKDTFVFIFLVFIFNTIVNYFNPTYKVGKLKGILILIVCIIVGIFMLKLKAYVFYSFIVSLAISYYNRIIGVSALSASNKVFGYFINFCFIGLIVGLTTLGFQSFQSEILRAQEEALSIIQGFHSWHTVLGGSSYSLGITEYTFFGILSKTPLAFLVTYFGPFPWQVKSPIMLFTALESYIFFILFIRVVWKDRFGFISKYKRNNIFLFSIIFSLIFGSMIGVTSYNYGALARFKIQSLPFFLLWLLSFYKPEKNRRIG